MIDLIVGYIVANYIPLLALYVGGGALYAVLKWTIQILKLRSRVLEIKLSDREEGSFPGYTDEGYIQYRREKAAYDIFDKSEYPPKASSNKGRLTMWAMFWPINLIYTMFADVAKGIWNFLYGKFGAVLQAIASTILPK